MIRVGGRQVEVGRAEGWVTSYFDGEANRGARKPFAYPAYDDLDTGSGPDQLNDGDLLAPTLLNAAPKIAAFFALQSVRSQLEDGLRQIPTTLTLQAAVADGSMVGLLGNLVSVIHGRALRNVQLTTLSKVLHRKRPHFIPLYDKRVKACYLGDGPRYPIQPDGERTWATFAGLLGACMARDLTEQAEDWERLHALVPAGVSPLRVLDVVAWNLGRD